MNTFLVWLLISLPAGGATSQSGVAAPAVVAQFASRDECERVAAWVMANSPDKNHTPRVGCIQTTIAK